MSKPGRMLTWKWADEKDVGFQRRLEVSFRGRYAIVLLTSTRLPDSWFVGSPRVFGPAGRLGIGLTVKEAAAIMRHLVAELLAEEFAGVDR